MRKPIYLMIGFLLLIINVTIYNIYSKKKYHNFYTNSIKLWYTNNIVEKERI